MNNHRFFYTISDGYIGKTTIDSTNITELFNKLNINNGNITDLNKEIHSENFTCSQFDINDIIKYISYNICIYLINNNKIVGICCILFKNKIITLSFLCVPPMYRGNGRILLNKTKEIADNIGYNIELYSMPDVVLYYKKNEFVIKDDEINEISKKHDVTNDDFDRFGMIEMVYISQPTTIPIKSPTSTKKNVKKRYLSSKTKIVKKRKISKNKTTTRRRI
jgi:hypothetical protein